MADETLPPSKPADAASDNAEPAAEREAIRKLAHELANHLLPILILTRSAMETLPPGPVRDDLERVLDCARKARDLVRGALAQGQGDPAAPAAGPDQGGRR